MSEDNHPTARILVVDDEVNIRFFLEEMLSRDGYQVVTAENGKAALRLCEQEEFDLALVDLSMPDMGGIELISALHQLCPDTITIVLTAYGSLETAVEAMRQGAHDYLAKPCKIKGIRDSVHHGLMKRQQEVQQRALLMRLEHDLLDDLKEIRAAVHPYPAPAIPRIDADPEAENGSCLVWKDLSIDLTRHTVILKDQPLDLSPMEFNLLACLASEAPGVVSSQRLVFEVHGYESQPWEASRLVRFHIYRIRQKSKTLTGSNGLIRTVRGFGYTLSD